MTNQELLCSLKKEAAALSLPAAATEKPDSELTQSARKHRYLASRVAEYNRQILLEISDKACVDAIEEIDPDALNEFTFQINSYLKNTAPDQAELQCYVRLTTTYLTFIAWKPLHPPGLIFAEGQKLIAQGGIFYCPVKKQQMNAAVSLCKYCVSRDIGELQNNR
ncbi:DUF2115 family protein [Sporomusa aerivorans]|uniref:DUF2115 family protein n=1 Tax=Sporomusa aerivorans TaxID=204936 RepID=UPI00352B7BDD